MRTIILAISIMIASTATSAQCAKLTWVRDEGNVSIFKALQLVDVQVTLYRNGSVSSGTTVNMRPGDEIRFLMNINGASMYHGFSC